MRQCSQPAATVTALCRLGAFASPHPTPPHPIPPTAVASSTGSDSIASASNYGATSVHLGEARRLISTVCTAQYSMYRTVQYVPHRTVCAAQDGTEPKVTLQQLPSSLRPALPRFMKGCSEAECLKSEGGLPAPGHSDHAPRSPPIPPNPPPPHPPTHPNPPTPTQPPTPHPPTPPHPTPPHPTPPHPTPPHPTPPHPTPPHPTPPHPTPPHPTPPHPTPPHPTPPHPTHPPTTIARPPGLQLPPGATSTAPWAAATTIMVRGEGWTDGTMVLRCNAIQLARLLSLLGSWHAAEHLVGVPAAPSHRPLRRAPAPTDAHSVLGAAALLHTLPLPLCPPPCPRALQRHQHGLPHCVWRRGAAAVPEARCNRVAAEVSKPGGMGGRQAGRDLLLRAASRSHGTGGC